MARMPFFLLEFAIASRRTRLCCRSGSVWSPGKPFGWTARNVGPARPWIPNAGLEVGNGLRVRSKRACATQHPAM